MPPGSTRSTAIEAIDGYAAKARAAQLLNGLGFANDTLERPVTSFSGGWRMRLNLARALMHRADLLLLDEPTNHLDLEAILWLEQYLARYPGSILLVSHDREFLNACVNRIAHVHDQVIDSYAGDYDDFERARAEKIAQQNQAFQQQQAKIAHLEDFVRRFRAKATKAKQAQSRVKALERLTRIAPAHVDRRPFRAGNRSAGTQPGPAAARREHGLRLWRQNAVPEYQPGAARRRAHRPARAERRGQIHPDQAAGGRTCSPLRASWKSRRTSASATSPSINWKTSTARRRRCNTWSGSRPRKPRWRCAPSSAASAWPANSEDRPVASFSGGEKSRLALALLAWQKPHLLLLDEPTNHLDLDMRDALTLALEEYTGAVVLVSHDRSLIRAVADELWLVADGEAKLFDGDLEDYKSWIEARRPREAAATQAGKTARRKPRARPKKKALLSKQAKLETELATAQAELAEINRQLADPATYAKCSGDEIGNLNARRESLETREAELEESWLELEMALEEAT